MRGEKITDSELLIMKVLWETTEELSLPGITNVVNERFDKTWKPQTVSTFLARLVKKDYLTMVRKGRIFLYYPTLTMKEYATWVIGHYAEFFAADDAGEILRNFMDVRALRQDEIDKEYYYFDIDKKSALSELRALHEYLDNGYRFTINDKNELKIYNKDKLISTHNNIKYHIGGYFFGDTNGTIYKLEFKKESN